MTSKLMDQAHAVVVRWLADPIVRPPVEQRNRLAEEIAAFGVDAQAATYKLCYAALKKHWLFEIVCHHADRTDVAVCACGRWRSEPQPSVGAAVERWVNHVFESAEPTGVPEPNTCENCDCDRCGCANCFHPEARHVGIVCKATEDCNCHAFKKGGLYGGSK